MMLTRPTHLALSNGQVFHIVASVAARTGRHPPPPPRFGPELAPATPEQSEDSASTAAPSHRDSGGSSLELRTLSLSPAVSNASGEPAFICDVEDGQQRAPLQEPGGLFRDSSSSSLDGLSCASITSSPVISREALTEVRTYECQLFSRLAGRWRLRTAVAVRPPEQCHRFLPT